MGQVLSTLKKKQPLETQIFERKFIVKWTNSDIISSVYKTINNKLEGECLLFDRNGKLHTINVYKNGKLHGEQIYYNCYLYISNRSSYYLKRETVILYENGVEIKTY